MPYQDISTPRQTAALPCIGMAASDRALGAADPVARAARRRLPDAGVAMRIIVRRDLARTIGVGLGIIVWGR